MDRKALARLWERLANARKSLQDASALESLALAAGRTPHPGGNHVMWQSPFPDHPAFPIGRHGGKVGHHPQKVILNGLEADAAAWEEWLDAQEQEDEYEENP